MSVDKRNSEEYHYYSGRLTQKLSQLHEAVAAVVEAPSGYGKTTAVRDYLNSGLSQDTPVFWFTAAEEEPLSSYRRLCRAIGQIDAKTGIRLDELGLPCAATVGEADDILRNLRCPYETWLVLDNMQLLQDALPLAFFSSLLTHGGRGLHVVLLSQLLRRDLLAFIHRHGILYISQEDLCLSAADVQSYFQSMGTPISEKAASQVAHNTDGWIAAIYLHLRSLEEHGSLPNTAGSLSLMENLVWNALTPAQQMFLLRISLFETITVSQAVFLCGGELSEEARQALRVPFIRFDAQERRYELHELLFELLYKKRRERGTDFERECLARAGDWCREKGQFLRAMEYYIKTEDFDRILSLNLSMFYAQTIENLPFYKLASQIVQDCPEEIMQEHLLSMLRMAYALLTSGKEKEFAALLGRLRLMLTGEDAEHIWLLADWTLLSSFRSFPDIPQMTVILEQAAKLFGDKSSRVIFSDSPWSYSVVTPFSLFHTTLGEMEHEAQALEEYYGLYSGITGGHGAGTDILFLVEHAYYACDFHKAEILAYKAAFVAQSQKQEIIRLAATFHLAWIAAQKGDSAGWRHAFAALTGAPDDLLGCSFVLPSSVDTVRGILLSELGMEDEAIPEWISEGDFSKEQLPGFELLRVMLHFGTLLHRKNFLRLVGTAEAIYPRGLPMERFGNVFPTLAVAAGYAGLDWREEAATLIRRAAEFMLPGGLYAQLIVYDRLTNGLVEQCISDEYPEYQEAFHQAKEKLEETFSSIYPSFSADELPVSLTEREHEVALLAASGLTNKKIAKKLSITVSTVRTHLRSVFRKLNIDRRTKLADKLR